MTCSSGSRAAKSGHLLLGLFQEDYQEFFIICNFGTARPTGWKGN